MINIRKLIGLLTITGTLGVVSITSSNPVLAKQNPKTTAIKKATTQPANQNALTKGNVPKLWSQGYQGQGMVVAVIDSGVQNNQEFQLSSNATAKISKSQAQKFIAQKGYGKYISPKIPFAYDYVNNNNDDSSADSVSGFHGLMVAGVAAANGVARGNKTKFVQGVAPEAQILNLKVYGGFSDESPNDVARAIYDAVDLGADVINMSLGIGVGNESLNDQEQAAVKYATDHGVFVAVAGSNYGHAGSITTDYNEQSNSTITTYEPANSGTISDPAISPFATTVGDENTKQGDKSEMDSFSAWGPTPDFKLKPDVSAPGQQIAVLDQNNHFTTNTGTSFASPYIAGSAALLMQKLKKDSPTLTGAKLVEAVKVALMNAAQPMANDKFKGELISPRLQGAGQVNVTKAANLKASAGDPSGNQGSISLKTIGQATKFNVALTNHSSEPLTYHINTASGPFTESRKTNNHNVGPVHDTAIPGATLQSANDTVTVDPGKTQLVPFTLDLGSQANLDSVAEGYLTFENADSNQNLTVPYFGYYGDPTDEQVVDKPANQADSIFNGGYLMDAQDMPLGLSDRTSLASWLNTLKDPDELRDDMPEKIQSNKVAFSPNGDGHSDAISPYVFTTQNLQNVTAEITDANGKVIRTVDNETNTQKSIEEAGSGYIDDLTLSPSMRLNPKALNWNGMTYDQSTGKMTVVPDGQYHYVLQTTNFNAGAKQQQEYSLPVKVDTVAPKITKATYQNGRLAVNYSDVGVGFTSISTLAIQIGHQSAGVSLNNSGQSNTGSLVYKLSAAKQRALKQAKGKLKMTLADVAGNQTKRSIKVSPKTYNQVQTSSTPGSKLVWTLKTDDLESMMSHDKYAVTTRFSPTKGITFKGLNDNDFTLINAASRVYDPQTHQLTIAGKVANLKSKLTILRSPNQNAKINQVKISKTGSFKFEMPINPTTQQGIGYILKVPKKHQWTTAKGTLVVIADTTAPTLNLSMPDNVSETSQNHYRLTTSNDQFTISGTVNDNVDGYRLFINGNNLFHEQNNAGWVNHQDLGANPNPHSPHQFTQTFNLNQGTNIFQVSAVDENGNQITKTIIVTRK